MDSSSSGVAERTTLSQRLNDYYELCKPRVVLLIVFTAMVGMFLATPTMVPIGALVFGTLGIGLMSASAAAVNQMIDVQADSRMRRTRKRPLVTGHLDTRQSAIFAFAIGVLGMAILLIFVNALTAWLTLFALVGYAGIYTMYLKRATPQNIVIGGAAGAAPPILGWAAVTNSVSLDSIILFLIIFIWTPPHFWALAIDRAKEYAEVDIPMLPVTHGIEHTRTQVLVYTVIMFAVSLAPYFSGLSGPLYLVSAILLSGWFLVYAVRLKWWPQPGLGMKTFGYSIVYLMALFTALLVDHYVPLIQAGLGS
ncbi:heme o synthase [Salinisphaera sp. Q1T1-3]|uniref:heme o synthase n=1 Tax=Salinisphaera sp. Q1T1-3 TaxID=2321229 RepID=UPI000E73F051|nr:heme o synthase [Salinisphaera sp. Q1T1-3]RJS94481.1 protoheme IX farnesyltransferase [Salinisphaera sp. Q1T1-3]